MDDFESLGLKGGSWQGLLRRETVPMRLLLVHQGEAVGSAAVAPQGPELWAVSAAIPAHRLADGVQTFLLVEDEGTEGAPLQPGGQTLAALSIAAGRAVDQDLLVEIGLLRSELDLLKREVRRLGRATA